MLAHSRRLWLRLHRWAALGFGWLLALSALLGAALVVAPPLDRWSHPHLFLSRPALPGAPAPLEPVRQRLLAEFGPDTGLTFRPPRDEADTLWVRVRGAWRGTVYVDPVTGLEQGRRGEHEGAYNLLFELHSEMLMGDTGRAVLSLGALAYLALLLAGLVLWWPRRWPPDLRVAFNRGALRAGFDLHRSTGVLAGLLILVSVASGAYMAWHPLRGWVSALAGQPASKPPKVVAVAPQPTSSVEELVQRAQASFPGAPIGYIVLPAQPTRAAQVRFRLPDDPHPNGRSSAWLHPVTGEVLLARRWNELDVGERAVSVIYPLHAGLLGGPLHALLTALAGLSLAFLGGSGLWLWWRRRRR